MESARTRAAITASLATAAVAAAPLVSAFSQSLTGALGNVTWDFTLHVSTVLALLAASLAALGSHLTVSAHRRSRAGDLSHTVHYWTPATMLAATAAFGAVQLPLDGRFPAALAAFGLTLGAILLLEHATVERASPAYVPARWALSAMDYVVALATFLLIIGSGISATMQAVTCGLVATALSIDLLRRPGRTPLSVAAAASIIGAVVGSAQSRIALWGMSVTKEALLLLVLLYALGGALQQHYRRRLTWVTSLEYLAFLVLGSIVVFRVLP